MPTLGQKLRDERIRQGKQIRPIAEELRIGTRYLEAIEADDWGQLPGGFFNRSFVRQYAQSLGFNGQTFELEYAAALKVAPGLDREVAQVSADPRGHLDAERDRISLAPVTERYSSFFDGRTGLAIAALVVLVAGGGAISLMWDSWRVSDTGHAAARTPVPAPIVAAAPPIPEPQAAPVEIAPASATIPPDSSEGMMSLNIAATEKTWIEVTADGKRIFVGVLEPGQSQTVSTSEQARMLVGNAGGITVQKAGRDIGPIGPRGQVRVVRVTKDQVEISQPSQPAPVGSPRASGEV